MLEDILRQKARTTWADEGDTNSKYFYRVVNEKRRSSHLPRFKNNQEVWVEGNQDISNDAIQHFSNLFTHSPSDNDLSILECIDLIVSEEENNLMHSIHEVDAIKDVVFSINPNSFTGPDGFNGHFCQASWDIIKEEVYNQSGFVKGRLITENIFLAQEIVHGIRKWNKGGNIVMKLDMSKAYDELSWGFLTNVLRKMNVSKPVIELIPRLIAHNWYSILINGTRYGFFKSTRGLKQGDHLSPSLFILAVESLTKALNRLNGNNQFIGFSMSNKGPKINHFSYADDLILFSSGDRKSIRLLMNVLEDYQDASGQQINKEKSFFLTQNFRDKKTSIKNRR
nr:uncharacterized protein LOC104089672 [Nicotiana tomentosiformis]